MPSKKDWCVWWRNSLEMEWNLDATFYAYKHNRPKEAAKAYIDSCLLSWEWEIRKEHVRLLPAGTKPKGA